LLSAIGKLGSKIFKRSPRRQAAKERWDKMSAKSRKGIQKRVDKSRPGRQFAREFARRYMDSQFGLSSSDFSSQSPLHKMGIFGSYLGKMASTENTPPIQRPKKVAKETSPTVSTLGKQLESLAQIAEKLSDITKQRQDALVEQQRDSSRLSKEASQEMSVQRPGEMVGNQGNDINPLQDPVADLIDEFRKLTQVVKQKKEEVTRSSQANSFGEEFSDRMKRKLGFSDKEIQASKLSRQAAKWNPSKGLKGLSAKDKSILTSRGYTVTPKGILSPGGIGVDGKPTGGGFTSLDEVQDVISKGKPSLVSRAGAKVRSASPFGRGKGSVASRVGQMVGFGGFGGGKSGGGGASGSWSGAGSTASKGGRAGGSILSRIANVGSGAVSKIAPSVRLASVLSKGTTTATQGAAKANPGIIKRIAGPIIAKGLGKTALKSIPIIGAVAGGLFAVDRLIKGDVVGAGLELASGLGGPLTAIPAFIASTARDTYTGIYGTDPETDPQVGERLGVVKEGVTGLVETELKRATTEGSTPAPRREEAIKELTPPPTSNIPVQEKPKDDSASSSASNQLQAENSQSAAGAPGKTAAAETKPAAGGTPPPAPAPPASKDIPTANPGVAAQEAKQEGPVTQTVAEQVENKKADKPGASMTAPPPAAIPEAPPVSTGADVINKTVANDQTRDQAVVVGPGTPSAQQMKPAMTMTTKNGSVGMGNVPSVLYGPAFDMSDIGAKIFFDAGI
jgi:hypothetical protein